MCTCVSTGPRRFSRLSLCTRRTHERRTPAATLPQALYGPMCVVPVSLAASARPHAGGLRRAKLRIPPERFAHSPSAGDDPGPRALLLFPPRARLCGCHCRIRRFCAPEAPPPSFRLIHPPLVSLPPRPRVQVHRVDGWGADSGAMYSDVEGSELEPFPLMDRGVLRGLYPDPVSGAAADTLGLSHLIRTLTLEQVWACVCVRVCVCV